MKVKLLLVAVIVTMVMGATPTAQREAGSAPTYNQDVASIIFDECVVCHRPGQIAPMSFMSYQEVRPWARAIKFRVAKREMPPWHADPRFGAFANERRLTDEQIQTIAAWADAGAPQGSGPLAAKPPPFKKDGWSHPSGRLPDLIIEMADSYIGKATGETPWFNMYQELPDELTQGDNFIDAIQIIPEVVEAVHHMAWGIKPIPPGTKIGYGEAWPGGDLINGALLDVETGKLARVVEQSEGVVRLRRNDEAEGESLDEDERDRRRPASEFYYCCYLPGSTFQQFPPGSYMRLPKEGMIEWGTHYTMLGKPFSDRTRVGLWFAKEPMFEVHSNAGTSRSQIVQGKELVESKETPVTRVGAGGSGPVVPVIPPFAKDWAITAITAYPDDVTLYTLYPHMHLRGKEMHYVVTFPDGREELILSVPKYDFNWQTMYELKEPLKVPAGSTIKTVGSYDNSPRNRWASEPQKEVYWSEQSWDEMYNGFRVYSVDKRDRRLMKSKTDGGSQ